MPVRDSAVFCLSVFSFGDYKLERCEVAWRR